MRERENWDATTESWGLGCCALCLDLRAGIRVFFHESIQYISKDPSPSPPYVGATCICTSGFRFTPPPTQPQQPRESGVVFPQPAMGCVSKWADWRAAADSVVLALLTFDYSALSEWASSGLGLGWPGLVGRAGLCGEEVWLLLFPLCSCSSSPLSISLILLLLLQTHCCYYSHYYSLLFTTHHIPHHTPQ